MGCSRFRRGASFGVRPAVGAVTTPPVVARRVRDRRVVGRSRTAAVPDALFAHPVHRRRRILRTEEAFARVRAAVFAVAAPEVPGGCVREGGVVGDAGRAAVANALVAHAVHRRSHETLARIRAAVLAVAAPEVSGGRVLEGGVVGGAGRAAVAHALVAHAVQGNELDALPGVGPGVKAIAAPRVPIGLVRERGVVGSSRRAAVAHALVAHAVHGHVQDALLGVRAAVQTVTTPHMDDFGVWEHGVVGRARGAAVYRALVAHAVYRLLPRRALGGPQRPPEKGGRKSHLDHGYAATPAFRHFGQHSRSAGQVSRALYWFRTSFPSATGTAASFGQRPLATPPGKAVRLPRSRPARTAGREAETARPRGGNHA